MLKADNSWNMVNEYLVLFIARKGEAVAVFVLPVSTLCVLCQKSYSWQVVIFLTGISELFWKSTTVLKFL